MSVQISIQVFALAAQLTILFSSESRQRILNVPYPAVDAGTVDPEDISYLIGAVGAFIIEDAHCL